MRRLGAVLVWAAWCACASKNKTALQRGFLLAATKTPVDQLRNASNIHDNLGAMLRDICATPFPARLVVRTAAEAAVARRFLPCAAISVAILGAARRRRRRLGTMLTSRLFKVGALAASLPLWPGGTLYLDNDVALRRDAVGALFGFFDDMRRTHKAVGLAKSHICIPKSHHARVPKGFCERNGGVVFFAPGNRSKAIADEWLAELERHTSADGHDQMPLRIVLWRNRDALFDLPSEVQIRSKRTGDPCKSASALLWHVDHADRVKWARHHTRSGIANGSACGFLP